jgi:hypothetical protein
MAYGLGRSGWVTAQFGPGEAPPVELFKEWLDESYRAVAPKRLVKQLAPQGGEAPRTAPAPKRRRAAAGSARRRSPGRRRDA